MFRDIKELGISVCNRPTPNASNMIDETFYEIHIVHFKQALRSVVFILEVKSCVCIMLESTLSQEIWFITFGLVLPI